MNERTGRDYYTTRKASLLEALDEDARYWRRVIASRYGDDVADAVVSAARAEYEALIPEIPFIGGDANQLTGQLLRSARCLAIYRAMKARGRTVEEVGRALYDAVVARGDPGPPIPVAQRLSPEDPMRRRRERAEESQRKRYPGDWVYFFVEGDGRDFDYGYDFLECATQKLYRAAGASELLPFFCFLDFPSSRAAGLGLARTMTLAEGHGKCDHRFKRNRRTEPDWPPPFLRTETGGG